MSDRGKELESEAEFIQLANACDFLEHYHLEHTDDTVTRFRGKGDRPDIYVVGDPEWKSKLREFLGPFFPDRIVRPGRTYRRVRR